MLRSLLVCFLLPISLAAQDRVFPVYTAAIPCLADGVASARADSAIGRVVTNVVKPTLDYYAPVPRASVGKAIVLIPGGGYAVEAWDHEGTDVARYLSAQGYHVFILAHRLPMQLRGECKSTAALDDAQEAILRVRQLADSLSFPTDHVGIMGFSAGGHLAGSASVHSRERAGSSSRPDFSVLVYPVTLMNAERTGHAGSQYNLLGEHPHPDSLAYHNLPSQIDSLTPPTLLVHASDDRAVIPENSLAYYRALVRHGVEADLRIYAHGGHGFGSARERPGPVSGWLEEVTDWLANQ